MAAWVLLVLCLSCPLARQYPGLFKQMRSSIQPQMMGAGDADGADDLDVRTISTLARGIFVGALAFAPEVGPFQSRALYLMFVSKLLVSPSPSPSPSVPHVGRSSILTCVNSHCRGLVRARSRMESPRESMSGMMSRIPSKHTCLLSLHFLFLILMSLLIQVQRVLSWYSAQGSVDRPCRRHRFWFLFVPARPG